MREQATARSLPTYSQTRWVHTTTGFSHTKCAWEVVLAGAAEGGQDRAAKSELPEVCGTCLVGHR